MTTHPQLPALPGGLPEGRRANITLQTDCLDENAKARYAAAFTAWFGAPPASITGIEGPEGLLEGSLNLVDVYAAGRTFGPLRSNQVQILMGNIAPRDVTVGQHSNGTPFCFSWIGEDALLVSTYTPELFRLLRRVGLVTEVNVVDVHDVMKWAESLGLCTAEEVGRVTNTQFRSLEFAPFLAWVLATKKFEVPVSYPVELDCLPHTGTVVKEDNFGNHTLDVLPGEVDLVEGHVLTLSGGMDVVCYNRLADVPRDGRVAVVIGSSGTPGERFLMVTMQGSSAAQRLEVGVGTRLMNPRQMARPARG